MVQSTQDRARDDLTTFLTCWNNPIIRLRDLLLDALMRSGSIEVLNIGVQHPLELLLMQDKQVIETLASHTPQKAFTDSIRSRCLIWCFEHLDPTRVRNPCEA